MKYFKWLLLIVTVLVTFSVTKVYARTDEFYEAEKVTNAYLKKFKPGATTGKYEQMRIFRRRSDNQAAYCIELWTEMKTDQSITGYVTKYAERAGITEEQWERIQLISYYGYGYHGHTTDNWYAASQYLIWKTLEPDSTIYFTDTLNGNKVSKFEAEISEIEKLVSDHYLLPSFVGETFPVSLKYGYWLLDNNKVLDKFNVSTEDGVLLERKNYDLRVKANSIGTHTINLVKEDSIDKTVLYVSPSSQNLIVRGAYPKIKTSFKVVVETGKVVFEKIDKDTKKNIPSGDASFDGTTYQLYDDSHQLVKEIVFTADTKTIAEELPYGVYYVKEVKSGKGYKIDTTEYQVIVNKSKINVVLEDEVYKGKLYLQKYYEEGASLFEEEGAKFDIYNSKNKLVKTVVTDSTGKAEIVLPYGNYRIHQISGRKNYTLVDDFMVSITDDISKEYNYVLKNVPIERYLKIIKRDFDTKKEIILSNASFKIKNLDSGEYVTQKVYYPQEKVVDVFTTNNQGMFITPESLIAGNYQLEEIDPPTGYVSLIEPISFKITEDIEYEIDEKDRKIIVLDVYNQKKIGTLNIYKEGEIFKLEQEQFYYQYQPLESVQFSLYASEDIIAGDGTILYKKGSVVKKITTDKSGKISISLPLGKYYILENNSLDDYRKDNKKYNFEITSDNLEISLKIRNYLKKGSVQIYKIDSVTKEALSNVSFSIYTKDNRLIANIFTDDNGIAILDSIPVGEYYLTETGCSGDYILNTDKIFFEIEDEKAIYLTIENDPILPPDTSVDESTIKSFLLLECLAIVCFGFLLTYYKKYL